MMNNAYATTIDPGGTLPTHPAGPAAPDLDGAIARFLTSLPLFAEVTAAESMDVMRLLRRVDLKPGEVLFERGDPPGGMWVLGEGCEIDISVDRGAGAAPILLSSVRTGNTVGEMALIDDSPRCATATVARGGEAHHIGAQDFEVLRARSHPASYKMMRYLIKETARRLRTVSMRVAPEDGSVHGRPTRPLTKGATVGSEDLEAVPAFRGLKPSVRFVLSTKLRRHTFPRGAMLFHKGDDGDSMFVLLDGEVSLLRLGTELARLSPGSMFGLISAVDGGPRVADCLALTEIRVLRLARKDLDLLFRSGSCFAYQILETVTRQMITQLRQFDATLLVQCPELPTEAQTAGDGHRAHRALALAEIDMNAQILVEDE